MRFDLKLQQCPGLTYSNAKYHSGSFLPPPLDTKNSLPPLGFISNNRSYASVAASHNQPKLSSKNDDDIWLSSRPELFSPANSWDHRLACDGEMPLAKQNMESFAQSSQFVGIFHSKMTYSSDYNTVIDSNQLPVLIPETILEDQLLLFSDGTSQLSTNPANALTLSSADSLNTLTNIRPWEHKSAERIPKELSTEWNDLGTVSRRYDSFLSSQVLLENASSMQQNGISSYDLGSEKFSYGFGDETQYAPIRSKPKDFPTFSSIATKMRHKPDKPSANLPTDPTLFQNEHKNLCHKYSRVGISDVNKLSYNDKIKYQKLLNLSYIERCKDQILSDIATLDLDTVDNLGNSISVLEQPDSSKDLSTISNSLLPFTRDGSHSYFSKPDNKFGAVEQYHPRYNGAHAWTMNPLCSEIMVKKEDFVEDLPNKQCLEVSNASKVLKWNKLPYANEVVGSPLTRAISQHPNSNFVQRTTLSTPPGFPPKQTFIGSTLQNQSQHSIYAFSNAMTTSNNSHTDILYTDSTKLSSAKEIHPSFCSPFNAY